MTTNWTKITKASGTSFTKVAPPGSRYGYAVYGKGTYGNTGATWTNIARPSTGSSAVAGLYYGFGGLTYSGGQALVADSWTRITKAT